MCASTPAKLTNAIATNNNAAASPRKSEWVANRLAKLEVEPLTFWSRSFPATFPFFPRLRVVEKLLTWILYKVSPSVCIYVFEESSASREKASQKSCKVEQDGFE